jgi:hypothetical protein
VSAAGTGFAESGISSPITLNPNQTATLTISFDPTTAGAFSGSVTISQQCFDWRHDDDQSEWDRAGAGNTECGFLQQRIAGRSWDGYLHGNVDFGSDERNDGEFVELQQFGQGRRAPALRRRRRRSVRTRPQH